ncbi:hypothetical protein [Lactococcus lactis]|uniref:Uncharacterized protein n=1 Tax=Lactococcus lactis subsp. lactis TaxID=1360 RepID=A0A1V0P4K4_LACLL|nr:hypothetical protein [Lactococcus lactis]ARE21689.1 hypothetical protein LLUC06_2147 [Lactococcus lactis subsp. lactis]
MLKAEIKRLKWWGDSESLRVIQEELVELRNYRDMREQEDKKSREEEMARNSFGF